MGKYLDRFNNKGLVPAKIGALIISLTLLNALVRMQLDNQGGGPDPKAFFEKVVTEGHIEGYIISFGIGSVFILAGLMAAYTLGKMGH